MSGLEGVTAAETRLSRVDGQAGKLVIAGFALEDIAGRATFEEMIYLLWHDRLPNKTELAALHDMLTRYRALPDVAIPLLQQAAAKKLPIMDALRIGASTLSVSLESEDEAPFAAIAAFPTIVAGYWRLLNDENPIEPEPSLSHAANYLYMLDGDAPNPDRVRALETYLNTVVDHGLNASTFTARVIISTQSDMISAVVGALGALKGPLHGGAPGPALDMVFEIGEPDRAEPYLRDKLERGERLMGFGHRVYKVRDPRADMLNSAARRFFSDDDPVYNLARHVEETAVRLLELYKPGRNLQTNVEYYTALLLHGIGLPSALFSPTFAVSRVAGWTAHAREQLEHGRLIRPKAAYTGIEIREWVPLDAR